MCDVFDVATFKKINSIKLASDADNVRYDSIANKIYVGYGNGGIAIIDATSFKQTGDIKLTGHPESFQIDKSANKIYVNVPDEKQIEVIDLEKNIVIERWKLTEARSNFPMSLDENNHRLFIGCRHPAKVLVLDAQTGKTISTFDIDNDVDDVFYDKKNNQIYLSCGGGYIYFQTKRCKQLYFKWKSLHYIDYLLQTTTNPEEWPVYNKLIPKYVQLYPDPKDWRKTGKQLINKESLPGHEHVMRGYGDELWFGSF